MPKIQYIGEEEEFLCRSTYDISPAGPQRVRVEAWTNDNRDDGYASEEAYWTLHFPSLEQALKVTGFTRVGFAGHRVEVRVRGVMVHTLEEAKEAFRCPNSARTS
jgi:hypothetical protein